MTRGMRYSPVASSTSVSRRIVSRVAIAEFHAMFAMNISSVSMRYGSPATALRITVCSMPCAASGYSQLNALSIRRGSPRSSTTRSAGACGNPSGAASSAPLSLRALPGFTAGGGGFGNGGW